MQAMTCPVCHFEHDPTMTRCGPQSVSREDVEVPTRPNLIRAGASASPDGPELVGWVCSYKLAEVGHGFHLDPVEHCPGPHQPVYTKAASPDGHDPEAGEAHRTGPEVPKATREQVEAYRAWQRDNEAPTVYSASRIKPVSPDGTRPYKLRQRPEFHANHVAICEECQEPSLMEAALRTIGIAVEGWLMDNDGVPARDLIRAIERHVLTALAMKGEL